MTELNDANETKGTKDTSGERAPDHLTRKWGWIAVLLASPLFFFFVHLGELGRARAAGIAGMTIIMTIRSRWDLRQRVWFWATVAILILAHVPLIMRTQWTNVNMPAVSLLPYAFLDWAIMYGCFKVVEKTMKRS